MTSVGPAGADRSRHEARERAVSLLYEAAMKGEPVAQVVADLPVPPAVFARRLVEGVAQHLARIDELVAAASVGWEPERMPVVDRTVLRLAVFELLEERQTPVAVIIDEAVELAKSYSTEQSGGFVNGVLATVARQVRGAERGPEATPGPD